tara:strand:- start:102068 stop:103213 length:1146 start_codon:yes stop_codon:yes gene_type:complete
MVPESRKILSQYFLPIILLLFYISEAFSKILLFNTGETSVVPIIIKTGVFSICIFYSVKEFHEFKWILFLIIGFTIGQIYTDPSFNKTVIINFIKYLFPLVLLLYFKHNKTNITGIQNAFKVFEGVIIFNSILVFLGFVLDYYSFGTYRGTRFGFNGLLITSATASYFYFFALFFYLIKFKERFLYSWLSYFVIIAALLVGTKALILTVICILVFCVIKFINRKMSFLLMAALAIIAVFYGMYFLEQGVFQKILNENGLLTAILSFRNEMFLNNMVPYIHEQWGIVNYLFGGISNIELRSQMGLFDLILFFGFLGSLIYGFTFYKYSAGFKMTVYSKFLIVLLSVIIILSGNFFLNASVAIYIVIMREFLVYNDFNGSKNI